MNIVYAVVFVAIGLPATIGAIAPDAESDAPDASGGIGYYPAPAGLSTAVSVASTALGGHRKYSWVKQDQHIVFIGALESFDRCSLKDIGVHPLGDEHQSAVIYGRYVMRPCRWIIGNASTEMSELVTVYDGSFVYRSGDSVVFQAAAGEPWIVPDEPLLIIARPINAEIDASGRPEIVYRVSTVLYLETNCHDDDQQVYRYRRFSFSPERAAEGDGLSLARCVEIEKRETGQTLEQVIDDILAGVNLNVGGGR